ncbi:MAG: hypothetical protein AAF682_02000 [Planctomycetota bacterium]
MDPQLQAALGRAHEVVFLCSGNMVRSAFADLYAHHLGLPLAIRSLATTYRNDRIFPETALALGARGVDRARIEGFRPTHVDDGLARVDPSAVLFGMRWHHLEPLDAERGRAFLLMQLLGREEEIADPVLEGADFGRTFDQVARCVEALVEHLRQPGTGR